MDENERLCEAEQAFTLPVGEGAPLPHAESKPHGSVVCVPPLAGGIGKASRTGDVANFHCFCSLRFNPFFRRFRSSVIRAAGRSAEAPTQLCHRNFAAGESSAALMKERGRVNMAQKGEDAERVNLADLDPVGWAESSRPSTKV